MGRDLVLHIDRLPASGASAPVSSRREMLGGKGANQAVALAQLGLSVALLGSVGADAAGRDVVHGARADGIDVTAVAERGSTALLVDVVEASGVRRLFEHVPPESLVRPDDIDECTEEIRTADVVCLQLQQPAGTLLAAVRLATGMVACDGAIPAEGADELLTRADVLRADHHESEQMTGTRIESVQDARAVAARLRRRGPDVVALAVPDVGDLVTWHDGERLQPHADVEVIDVTGAGDAFFAGLVAGLVNGLPPEEAAELAADAATSTVQRLGGRPDLAHLHQRATNSAGGWTPTR